MSSRSPEAPFAAVAARPDGLAGRWRRMLLEAGLLDEQTPEAELRLAQLADLVRDALPSLAAAGSPAGSTDTTTLARAIGHELALLHNRADDALGHLERVLPTILREAAAASGTELAPDRLLSFVVGVAAGYIEQTESDMRRAEEANRQANQRSLELAQQEINESHAKLALLNRDLIHELGERSQLENALRDYATRLENLQQVTLAILSAGELGDIIQMAVDHIQRQIPCHCVGVTTYNAATNTATVLFSNCDGVEYGQNSPITLPDIVEIVGTGQILYVADLMAIPQPSARLQQAIDRGIRSMLHIPMRYHTDLLGSLALFTTEVREFTQDEQLVGREIANVLAVAIQNHRLLEAEQEAHRRETTLRELARSVSSDLRLDEVLQLILAKLDLVVAADSTTIFLRDGDDIRIVAQRGLPGYINQLSDTNLSDMGGLKHVMDHAQPLIIDDTQTWEGWYVVRGMEHIRGWLGVPLIVRDRIIGVVTLDRREPQTFTHQDAEMALAFAGQAAVAIENARLFRQVERHADVLEQRVSERTRRLQTLYRIAAATNENLELPAILQLSLREVSRAFPEVACAIHLLASGGRFNLTACECGQQAELRADIANIPDDDPLLSQGLLAGAPWRALPTDLKQSHTAMTAGGYAAAPIAAHGHALGVLSLFGSHAAALSDEDLSLLGAVADQIAVAVETTSLRQRIRQTAIMEERERLGQELHDIVTQALYSLILFADAASDRLAVNDLAATRKHLRSISGAAQQALGEMRLLLFDLRSDTLAALGLPEALQDRLLKVEHRAGKEAELNATGIRDLPPRLEDAFYRIALEALNNTLRHAKAHKVRIDLTIEQGDLVMRVHDDGLGFDLEKQGKNGGQGLANMQKRAETVGGALSITSHSGQGTTVEIRAPLSG